MTDNLKMWKSVQKTDPAFTKEYSGPGGFSGTAVNASYLAMRATDVFGPCGTGWGYDVLEDRFDIGGPIIDKTTKEVLCNSQMHTIKLAFWYLGADGEKKTVIHYGHTPFITQNKFGVATDFEAPKKSLTDAIGKCLSQLGFSADIRLGLYDDIHYVSELKNESEIERADDKVEARERQVEEYREWLSTNKNLIETAQSLNELKKVYASAMRKLENRRDDKNKIAFTRSFEARKAELEPKTENAA